MAPATANQLARFCYAVVRVVPDPIKDEAVNVGVVVTPAEGTGGALRVQLHDQIRARIRAMQRGFDFEALRWALKDLESVLGIDRRLSLGEAGAPVAGARQLEDVARRLGNQLQLTEPRR